MPAYKRSLGWNAEFTATDKVDKQSRQLIEILEKLMSYSWQETVPKTWLKRGKMMLLK